MIQNRGQGDLFDRVSEFSGKRHIHKQQNGTTTTPSVHLAPNRDVKEATPKEAKESWFD